MYILRESSEELDNNLSTLMFEGYDFLINLTENVMEMVETSMNQEHQYLMSENTSILNESVEGVLTKIKEMIQKMIQFISGTVSNIIAKLKGRSANVSKNVDSFVEKHKQNKEASTSKVKPEHSSELKSMHSIQDKFIREILDNKKDFEDLANHIVKIESDIKQLQMHISTLMNSIKTADSLSKRDQYHDTMKKVSSKARERLEFCKAQLTEAMRNLSAVKSQQDTHVKKISEIKGQYATTQAEVRDIVSGKYRK